MKKRPKQHDHHVQLWHAWNDFQPKREEVAEAFRQWRLDQERPVKADEQRPIPTTNEIIMFWHCMNCFHDRPDGVPPCDWVRLEAGWTQIGFQLRCQRCDLNIIHVDFEGMQHPANLGGGKKTTTQ